MYEAKNTARALVRIGYDGRVYKNFRAADAEKRFDNEVRVLRYLEKKGCDFVPRLLEVDRENLTMVTTSCGARVEQIGEEKLKSLFAELESFGVRHDDPFLRNVTYRASDGRFCIIDFEFATILDDDSQAQLDPAYNAHGELAPARAVVAQTLRWSGITDLGRFRPNNEDVFLGIAYDERDFFYLGKTGEAPTSGRDFVFAVSDGMGGEKSGEFASKYTVDNITRMLPRRFRMSPAHYASGITNCLHEVFQNIHGQLTTLGRSYANARNMGATLSLLWYANDWFYFGHIGDSRIYHLPRAGGMRQITEDHTYVGWLRRKGELNERQARFHPRKNVLAQALGAGNQNIHPQIGEVHCESGDRFVLCSDGVVEGLWDRGIEELIREPPANLADVPAAQRLVQTAVAESGRDNATAMVIEVL